MVEQTEHEALYSTIVGLTIYVDDLIVEIQIDGTDSNHWGIKFIDVDEMCISTLCTATTECVKIISQIAPKIFEIQNRKENVNAPQSTPEFCQ